MIVIHSFINVDNYGRCGRDIRCDGESPVVVAVVDDDVFGVGVDVVAVAVDDDAVVASVSSATTKKLKLTINNK